MVERAYAIGVAGIFRRWHRTCSAFNGCSLLEALATRVFFMAIENRLIQEDLPPVTPSSSDAYEAYWCLTEDDSQLRSKGTSSVSADSLPFCRPGDAYNELWQIWDAR